ncbi:MAG: recombinase family protein [Bacillota bacterium]
MERAAIYCRISTDEDLQKYSLGGQERELRDLAARRGLEIAGVYIDQTSGAKASRPGLDRLRDDMAAGKFSIILVVDQDRLSRLDPVDWELLKREIRQAGVRVLTPSHEIDFGDEDSELLSDVFNLFARHQRRKLIKAMKRGREEALRRGIWLGKPPMGYVVDKEHKKLVPGGPGLPIVREIFQLYAEGWGSRRIARRFGISEGLVGHIIRSPVYRGTYAWTVNGKYLEIPNACEPIVDPGLWQKCNEIMDKRSQEFRYFKVCRERAILAGILVCSECGRLMQVKTIATTVNGRRYVYVYYKHRGAERGKDHGCRTRHRADHLDARVLAAIKLLGSQPAVARRLIRLRNDESEQRRLTSEIERIQAALQMKKSRLLRLYMDGSWERDLLDAERKNLDLEHRALEQRLAGLHDQLARSAALEVEYITEYFAALVNIDTELSPEEQGDLVQALFPRAEVNAGGDMVLTARIPFSDAADCQSTYPGSRVPTVEAIVLPRCARIVEG